LPTSPTALVCRSPPCLASSTAVRRVGSHGRTGPRGDRRARIRIEPDRPEPAEPADERARRSSCRGSSRSAPRCSRARRALRDTEFELIVYSGGMSGEGGWEKRYLSRLGGTLTDGIILVTPTVVEVNTASRWSRSTHTSAASSLPTVDSENFEVRRPRDRTPDLELGIAGSASSPADPTSSRRAGARPAIAPRSSRPGIAVDPDAHPSGGVHRRSGVAARRDRCHDGRSSHRRVRCERPVGDRGHPCANELGLRIPTTFRWWVRQHPRVGTHRSAVDHGRSVDPGARRCSREMLIEMIRHPSVMREPPCTEMPCRPSSCAAAPPHRGAMSRPAVGPHVDPAPVYEIVYENRRTAVPAAHRRPIHEYIPTVQPHHQPTSRRGIVMNTPRHTGCIAWRPSRSHSPHCGTRRPPRAGRGRRPTDRPTNRRRDRTAGRRHRRRADRGAGRRPADEPADDMRTGHHRLVAHPEQRPGPVDWQAMADRTWPRTRTSRSTSR
jgi:hypothetical protein